jgi:hypothetical protein
VSCQEATAMNPFCERPIPLTGDALRRRIYAPLAYASVRNIAVVPVVHSECLAFASWFPLVWRRCKDKLEFVTVRALLDDQRAQSPAARTLLPLLLHAYPFVFSPDLAITPSSEKMLDDVFADEPTDVGASITTVQRKLTRATISRLQILDRLAHDFVATQAVTEELAAHDAFEPWPLQFDIEGQTIEVPDLFVIRPAFFEGGPLSSLLDVHGLPCAHMLSLHRISLFRAGILLGMAKAVLRSEREARTLSREASSAPPLSPLDTEAQILSPIS